MAYTLHSECLGVQLGVLNQLELQLQSPPPNAGPRTSGQQPAAQKPALLYHVENVEHDRHAPGGAGSYRMAQPSLLADERCLTTLAAANRGQAKTQPSVPQPLQLTQLPRAIACRSGGSSPWSGRTTAARAAVCGQRLRWPRCRHEACNQGIHRLHPEVDEVLRRPVPALARGLQAYPFNNCQHRSGQHRQEFWAPGLLRDAIA